jgi:hypothetical protein
MFNDLIGLRYGWHCRPNDGTGKTDCFQLVCEARRRLGMSDYAPRFEWVYSVYDEFSLPPRQILRWLRENGKKSPARTGSFLIFPGARVGALGILTDHGILFIGPGGSVVHLPPDVIKLHSYWMKP